MAAVPNRSQPRMPSSPAAAKPVPAQNPVERVEVLIGISERLAALLQRERAAVERRALAEVTALQADKRGLAARFDEIARLVRLDKAGLAALPPELMERLHESSRRLADATRANAETLDVQALARRSVIDVAVKAANQEIRAVAAYASGRPGGLSPKVARLPTPRSSTFNTTL